MLECTEILRYRLVSQTLASHKFPIKIVNVVLSENTGDLMEYRALIKGPKYQKLYAQLYAKELGRLAQGLTER